MRPSIDCVLSCRNQLGESPVWSSAEQALYWVDIHGASVFRLEPASGAVSEWAMPAQVGSLGLRRGGLVLALRSGFGLFDLPGERLRMRHEPLAGRADMRFNDGRVDRRGRFWAGTLHEERAPGEAALYRLDARGCREMARGATVSNGIAWSPDDRTMYYACSYAREIYAYDFDAADGAISRKRLFARFGEDEGVPDGATVDIDGCYWVAHFDGGRITRFTPRGTVDRVIEIPVPRPTSCSFGGPGLDVLYVTSAAFGLAPQAAARTPLSGNLFALRVGTQGLPEPLFAA